MQKSARIVLIAAFCVLILAFLLHIGLGSSSFTNPFDVAREIFRGSRGDNENNTIVWGLRLPRAVQAVVVGAILGVSGAALQTLFRNPLAEPYIVGASSGAAIGAIGVEIIGLGGFFFGLPMAAAGFVTGMLTLVLVTSLARRRGVIETQTLLLAGVVTSTMLSSLLSCMILYSGQDQGKVLRSLLGSLSEGFWPSIYLMFVTFVVGYVLLFRSASRLNALSLGEEAAQSLGVDPHRMRWLVLASVTAMTSVTIGSVGIIGFVGLVAPHIARRLAGVDLKVTLPLSAICGSLILLLSDTIAQRGAQGAGIPVGIVTSILGAPVLLVLLKRR